MGVVGRWAIVLATAALATGCGEVTTPTERDDAAVTAVSYPSFQGVGDEEASVDAPDTTGEDAEDAQTELEEAGLTVELDPDRDPAGCLVQEQDQSGELEPDAEVTLTLNCAQVDWENEEGEAWEAFTSGYSEGFEEGCRALFSLSNSGLLFEQGVSRDLGSHDESECVAQEGDPSDVPADVPEDPEADGQELGVTDGCQATFDLAADIELYEEGQAYSALDCENAASVSSAGPQAISDKKRQPSGHKKTSDLYRVHRARWNAYTLADKRRAATYFLRNNPRDCGPAHLNPARLVAKADTVLNGMGNGDFAANEIMLDVCRHPETYPG